MRSPLALLLVLSVIEGTAAFGQAPNDEWSHYEITVQLEPKTQTLSGSELVEYYNDSDRALDALYFFLWANFDREKNPYVDEALLDEGYWNGFESAWTKITSVTAEDGRTLDWQLEAAPPAWQTYSLQETLLRVDLREPLAPGARIKLGIEFITKFPEQQFPSPSHHNGIYVWQFRPWFPSAMPAKTLALGRPAEQGKALKLEILPAWIRVRMSVPEDFKVAAGNAQQTIEKSDDGQKTLLLESYTPQLSMPFVMGEPLEVYQLDYEIPIEVYYLPGHETPARFIATIAADALKYYRTHFGEYGYEKLTIAEGPYYSLMGMGGDGMVLLGAETFRIKDLVVPGAVDRSMQAGMAHEVAHLWWGAGISFDANSEPWLAESFAQYMAIRYFEDKYGAFGPNEFAFKKGLLEGLIDSEFGYRNRREVDELIYLLTVKDGFDEAIVKPLADVEFLTSVSWYGRIYAKGSLVLRALEALVGQATMDRILQEAAKRHMHRIITTEDFQKIAEEISGKDLKGFFKKWLYSGESFDGRIDNIESQQTAEGWVTRVHLSRHGQSAMPLTLRATTKEGRTVEQVWTAEKPRDVLTFTTQASIQSAHLDPQSWVPDTDRFNNHWPRKFQFSFGKRILPLDAYAIRLSLLGIEGGFRRDHNWLLSLMPRFDRDRKFLLKGLGTFLLDLGRGASLSALLRLEDFDPIQRSGGQLTGQLGLRFTLYEHPQIGIASKWWEPANRFRVSLGRTIGPQETGTPANYLGFDYWRDNRPGNYWLTHLAARANLPGEGAFVKLSLDSFKRFRLMPNAYLDGKIEPGYSLGELPDALKFSLEALKSFASPTTLGNFKLSGQVSIAFPLVRELDYAVLNLLIVDELWGTPFVRAGQTWAKPQEVVFDAKQFKIEAGFELTVKTKSLFGLPLELTVGFAYPLQGFEGEKRGKIYFASLGSLLDLF